METDIIMDNGDIMDIFDVVDMKFDSTFPIKHHTENMKFTLGTQIKFIKKLNVTEQSELLKEIATTQLLKKVKSKCELCDEMINSGCSLVLVGPIASFDITQGKHPRLWVIGKNCKEFDIPCTDLKFCEFTKSKSADFKNSPVNWISSQNTSGLKGKQIFFVIGLTGDFLDENNEIKDGRYSPDETEIEPRYWPLVVSVLTIPSELNED